MSVIWRHKHWGVTTPPGFHAFLPIYLSYLFFLFVFLFLFLENMTVLFSHEHEFGFVVRASDLLFILY